MAAAAAASPSPTPKAGRATSVLIEALDSVEIEATIDNEPPRKVQLTAEAVQTFRAKRRVVLQISDGGAINLVVNGTDRGVPGDLGRPLRLELP